MMFIESLKLVEDGYADFVIVPSQGGVWLTDLDLGFPAVREVAENRANSHGTRDESAFIGARAVALDVKIIDTAGTTSAAWWTALRAWLIPSRRPRMVYKLAGTLEREMELRSSAMSQAMTTAVLRTGSLSGQCQWVCPSGTTQSSLTHEQDVSRQNPSTISGRVYPRSYPRTYPSQVGVGVSSLVNAGTIETRPIIKVFGPCVGPRLANESDPDNVRVMEFADYTLLAGEYLEIDVDNRTVQWNGLPGVLYSARSNMTTRQWWGLRPGTNLIRYTSFSGSSPGKAEIYWKDREI